MRSLAVVAAAGFVVLSLACGGGGGASQKEMAEFRDNPERFKGKELTFNLVAHRPDSGDVFQTLRQSAGKPYHFYTFVWGDTFKLVATLPDDAASLPDARGTFYVTFLCEEGRWDKGNRVVALKR